MIKRKLRHTKVSSLSELKSCVAASSPVSAANVACLVGSESGEVLVPTRDWQSFLMSELNYKRFAHIKNFHYFIFSADHAGEVAVQLHSEAPATVVHMTTVSTPSSDKPAAITPDGLSHERKLYLYEKIRQFCSDGTKDLLCPKPLDTVEEASPPAVHSPLLATGTDPVHEDPEMDQLPAVKRRKPTCSLCKKEAHRNSVKRDGTFWCPERSS